jgi:hypothetical protein
MEEVEKRIWGSKAVSKEVFRTVFLWMSSVRTTRENVVIAL